MTWEKQQEHEPPRQGARPNTPPNTAKEFKQTKKLQFVYARGHVVCAHRLVTWDRSQSNVSIIGGGVTYFVTHCDVKSVI